MKHDLIKLFKQLMVWKLMLVGQVKAHTQSWFAQLVQAQKQIYKSVHDWLAEHAPFLTTFYQKAPLWVKRSIFSLPWILLLLVTLNYLNVFDKSPVIKSVQDPNVVVANADLKNMVKDGKVGFAPFVEELRASGRIDFNELYLSRIGANVTGRVTEINAVPGQAVNQGDVLAKITST